VYSREYLITRFRWVRSLEKLGAVQWEQLYRTEERSKTLAKFVGVLMAGRYTATWPSRIDARRQYSPIVSELLSTLIELI